MSKRVLVQVLCCLICAFSMIHLAASTEPSAGSTYEHDIAFLAKIYGDTIDSFMAAIVLNIPDEVSKIFNDIFHGSLGKFSAECQYYELADAINKSVRNKLRDKKCYELLTSRENGAARVFNEIIQSCKQKLEYQQKLCAAADMPEESQQEIADTPNTSSEKQDQIADIPLRLCEGCFELQGCRPTMEDTHDIYPGYLERFAYYAVYDGHRGNDVSIYLKDHLREQILRKLELLKDPTPQQIQDAMREAFAQVELDMTKLTAGSTAVVVLIDKRERVLYCGNLGDSRAVISANKVAVALSHDHNVKDCNEQTRIKNAGGGFTAAGNLANETRTNGLAVSRSFGDQPFKYTPKMAAIMNEAEFIVRKIEPTDEFIIIACDGLWDVMDDQMATDFIAKFLLIHRWELSKAASELVNHAIWHLGSHDNVTAVVVTLHS